jgi:hypothetical protein
LCASRARRRETRRARDFGIASGNNDSARAKSARAEIFSRIEISSFSRHVEAGEKSAGPEKKGTEITEGIRRRSRSALKKSFIVRHRSQSVLQRSNTSTRHKEALSRARGRRARVFARASPLVVLSSSRASIARLPRKIKK